MDALAHLETRSLAALQQLGLDPATLIGAARLVLDGRIRPIVPAALARFTRDLLRRGRRGPSDLVHLHALNTPYRQAIVSDGVRLNWRDLDRRANGVAHVLYALGVRPHDRVGVLLHNGPAQIETGIATAIVGATAVQIGYRLKPREVAFLLSDSGAKALVFQASHREIVEEAIGHMGGQALDRTRCLMHGAEGDRGGFGSYEALLEANQGDEPPLVPSDSQGGLMVYTSGTTGHPKGANRELKDTGYGPTLNFIADLPMRHDERHLVVCPLYHSAAQFFATITISLGGTLVLHEHFDPERTLATIERERISSTLLVPTMWNRLLQLGVQTIRRYDLSSLRWVMSGAAPLPTELAGRIEEAFGPILYNFYGATETGAVTLARPGEHTARPGTIGRVVRGSEIRLLDEEGREVPVGEVGEIWVRNSMMMSGYFGNPEATRAASHEGFFSVGDLGRRDADGYYYLADRKTDMVISGGINIYPLEIEQRLHSHPAVHDVAVIGQPDPEWGESLVAFVVPEPGQQVTAEELGVFVTEALADFKRPRRFVFLDALPRNPTGKVLKRELRDRLTRTGTAG